jgi:hypothetical protein
MKPVKGGQGPVWAAAPLIIIIIKNEFPWLTIVMTVIYFGFHSRSEFPDQVYDYQLTTEDSVLCSY